MDTTVDSPLKTP
jgi:hypothetical protein